MPIERISKFLIKALPDAQAFRLVRALAARTQRPPLTPEQKKAMEQASLLLYGECEQNVAWSWGSGPLVILVHGWNGRAAQMAPLAASIAARGFRCVAIEVTGHGESPGNRTEWHCFIDDIASLARSLDQQVHAYVSHSAGGLATMAARNLKGIHASRYICICAPSHPYPQIDVIRKRLAPRASVIERYQQHIAGQFDTAWDKLANGVAYANAGPELLLFYDEGDRFVDHNNGHRIHLLCPGSRLMKTKSYGHSKILAAPELAQAAGEFLTGALDQPQQQAAQRANGMGIRGVVC